MRSGARAAVFYKAKRIAQQAINKAHARRPRQSMPTHAADSRRRYVHPGTTSWGPPRKETEYAVAAAGVCSAHGR